MRYVRMRRKLRKWKTLNRKIYHFGNEPDPYQNNKNPDVIDRRTYHGDGIPKTDIYIYNDKIRYNSQKTTWGCQNWDYKVRKHRKTQIIGRTASAQGHTAGRQTTGWKIPLNEQPPTGQLKHTELDDANGPMIHFERRSGRIAHKNKYPWLHLDL